MSNSRSETAAPKKKDDRSTDPLRPSDHVDGSGPDIESPRLGVVGWLRWGWRQLTSMRTALVLLLILAIAAIPGSIFPQRMADPNGVTQWKADHPDLFPILDSMQLFDVYLSAWFSAIYLLLFLSLVGCVIPRIKHHAKALRSLPPRTPVRLQRLDDHRESTRTVTGSDPRAAAEQAVAIAQKQLRALRYRVERYDDARGFSVSAERGYARETGNLIFHLALLGVLVSVGVGGSFAYTGQRVVVEGTTFVNTLLDYSSMNRGRFVSDDALAPYRMTLDSFDVTYQPYDPGKASSGQAGDFSANVTASAPGEEAHKAAVVVNHPLGIAGDRVYLLGNGYAPTITVRNAKGDVVFHDSVPFLPQNNATMTSLGVVKVPDGLPKQLGMVGFFYPTAAALSTGAFTSAYPDLINPLLTLNVYAGDLGIDDGTPRSVYVLDPTRMTQLTGGKTGVKSLELAPGETAQLPDGMGSVTFDNEAPQSAKDYRESVKRYVSLQIHHDPSEQWVLVFAGLAVLGLVLALFVPRRRMWVKASVVDGAVRLEYAGLARGEDPTLAAAVDDLLAGHARLLDADGGTAAVPEPEPSVAEPVPGNSPEAAPTSEDEPDDSGRFDTLGDR
ncbi:cytochrome c biogenesis protein ResB [Microbacterium capsulatum]|uniref:Cytochrome c biogenesis protein ResB n=1 Tax=Microbacterium capsulatum TaxID=3041921 RepID=A0ABU0XM72_9MICO|nr:cytochrome c biogenesis protein ResB [Microbacterium sp. ASV81]MDQ4215688.1 cytochrome c biogenesis protein ResB [Microbacterium sp. ASV81]